ncbi:homeodomain transcription factor [Mycena pura]|uniref:Homeodomain transcription factor n=1 Tax=Mycena pura TaxID=153505 RepID=A0AAD6VQE4_9AGAR|nr:homeodomain transcription factor [Mycena pura]
MAGARAKLQINPAVAVAFPSTPSPSTASTALSPLASSPSSQTTEEEDKVAPSSAKSDPDKPKRCRVTPDQLVHLEHLFITERSPTASRRREISELLGMQERQTQIWFQNRRAKAKLQNSKIKKAKDLCQGPDPRILPRLSMSFENELNNLIHEDEPVTFIPCTSLAIGCWQRITVDTSQRDLVAYTCENKRCLTWFIHNGGVGFKMEISLDTIVHAEFTHTSSGPTGLASFALSRPPLFYLESPSDHGLSRQWKRSTDWTEGHQASQVLRHDLVGNATSLAFLVQSLQVGAEGSSPLTPYHPSEPPSPMEIPLPPLSVIQRTEQQRYSEECSLTRPRRRSYAAANDLSHLVVAGLSHYRRELPHTAPPVSYTHTSYVQGPTSAPAHARPILVVDDDLATLEDYGARPISHDMTPRSYSAQPVLPCFYEKPTSFLFDSYTNDEDWATDGNSRMYHLTADHGIGLCLS